MKSLYTLVPVSLLTAALALAGAGCGGSSQSAQEKWANDVCTQVVTWNNQMKQLVNDAKSAVSSPDAGTIDTLKSDAQNAVDATKELKTNLKNLPPAPGDNGQPAKDTLTTFASQMNQAITSLKSSVDALSSSTSVSQAATALAGAAGQLSTFSAQAKTALDSVQQTSSELKSGFENASACKELKGSS